MKKPVASVMVHGDQAKRLLGLAQKWGVEPDEALRRVLDQAFFGRGALIAIEAGFIAIEHFTREKTKPEEKKPEEEKKP